MPLPVDDAKASPTMPQQPQHEAQQFQAAIPIDRAGSRMPESSQNASLPGETNLERWATRRCA